MAGEEFKANVTSFHPKKIIRQVYIIIYGQSVALFEMEKKKYNQQCPIGKDSLNKINHSNTKEYYADV